MMSKDSEPLLRGEQKFDDITPEKLSGLFDMIKISDGTSHKELVDELKGTSGLCQILKIDPKVGVSQNEEEIKSREEHFGNNEPITKPLKTFLELVWEQLQDLVLQILIIAAIISLVIGMVTHPEDGWLEGCAILVAVVIVVGVGSVNDWVKQKQFEKLNKKIDEKKVIVLRDGAQQSIDNTELVVGDILYINQGDALPADGILLASHNLRSDQSNVNGESKPCKKRALSAGETTEEEDISDPFLISGSKVEVGNGEMLICAVGRYSFSGQQMLLTQAGDEEETPLQTELGNIALDIGKIGTAVAILTVIALTIHLLVDAFALGDGWDTDSWTKLLSAFIIGITVIVVAVPEGLPLAVTIALAFSINKMRKENNLVRHLHACESMGCANNICSDKTGTITENKMHVAKIFMDKEIIEKEDFGSDKINGDIKGLICDNACINSTALVDHSARGKTGQSKEQATANEFIGDRTECALLMMAEEMGKDFHYLRKQSTVVHSFPFDSSAKMMTTMVKDMNPPEDNRYRVYVKGAPDIVLDKCDRILRADQSIEPLSSSEKEEILEMLENKLAADGLRTILVAYRILENETEFLEVAEEDRDRSYLEHDLIFTCIAGIEDAIRQGVPDSVLTAQRAGITVRMITGDHPKTAVVVSKRAHILPDDYEYVNGDGIVMTGQEFEDKISWSWLESEEGGLKGEVKDLESFDEIQQTLRVIARSSYQHKYMLVTGLKQLESVVAVTGDGTNDAAALKQSDVGLAMNIVGTDIAKAASDIIIVDDNFNSIITAVKWGRNIYDSIRKFLQFQLTINLVALMLVFIGAVALEASPLTAVQMLWVNLIMDSMAALALATEPPTDKLLDRVPTKKTEYIVTTDMMFTILGQTIYQSIVLLVILFAGPAIFGIKSSHGHDEWTVSNGVHFTIFFNTFELFFFLIGQGRVSGLKSSLVLLFLSLDEF